MESSSPPFTAGPETLLTKANDFARMAPTKAVVSAFSAGLLMHVLPVGALIGGLVTVALTFARPFLLVLGVIKACEFCGHLGAKKS